MPEWQSAGNLEWRASQLDDDQIKQMETERNAFQTATQGIHQQLKEKRQALQAELAKQTPDPQHARPSKGSL